MIEIVDIPIEKTTPSIEQVLSAQGITDPKVVDEGKLKIGQTAVNDYLSFAQPIGIISKVTNGDFASIYSGEGNNEPETPLDLIHPDAIELTLFAVTLGEGISVGIELYFARNDFAAGAMLDAAASEGAELAAAYIESFYKKKLAQEYKEKKSIGVMRFSPGYCGWHVSGQRKLFEALQPDKIGIELTQSSLMQPLKSISGVIVAGPMRLFEFEDNFSFCANCEDHSCLERIRLLVPIKK